MSKVSIVIPAYEEPYLGRTVDGIFESASGDIEVIVILENYWPKPPLKGHENLIIVHKGVAQGMRQATNTAARIATGDYLMKCDAHCIFGEGFDEILVADSEPGRLSIPSRYGLDAEKWERIRGPVDYLTLTFPYVIDELYGNGLHGKKWKGEGGLTGSFWHLERERKDILVDEILTFQGSCWLMERQKFFDIGGQDHVNYTSHQEAQEMGMKVWLSGGNVVRNKKTWYAHLHKTGKRSGAGSGKKERQRNTVRFSTDFWMNDRWDLRVRDIKWLIDKFWPLEGWPDDWQDPKYAEDFVPTGWTYNRKKGK